MWNTELLLAHGFLVNFLWLHVYGGVQRPLSYMNIYKSIGFVCQRCFTRLNFHILNVFPLITRLLLELGRWVVGNLLTTPVK